MIENIPRRLEEIRDDAKDQLPNIYLFDSYVEYLESVRSFYSRNGLELSFNLLGKKLQLGSRTKAKKIFKGEVDLPKWVGLEITRLFKLDPEESGYFEFLRKFQQTNDPELAFGLYKKILDMRKRQLGGSNYLALQEKQLNLLDRWYYGPMLYYFELIGEIPTPNLIQQAFRSKLSIEEIENAIQVLRTGGWLDMNGLNQTITLMDHIPRPLVKKFHFMMVEKALESIYHHPQDKRFLMGATLNLKSETLPAVKKEISEFYLRLVERFSAKDADTIYQFQSQLFSLVEIRDLSETTKPTL